MAWNKSSISPGASCPSDCAIGRILRPDWNRRFNRADDADGGDANSRLPEERAFRRPDSQVPRVQGGSSRKSGTARMTLRLPCALDRAQVGPERFGSKGTNHNSYRSIQLNAGRREVSIRRLPEHARCWPRAACCQTVTGCWCTWHRGPRRTRQGCRKSFQDLRQRGLPDRLAARGSKGPEQGRGAISRRSAGTPASGGRYSRWHPQRVERFQPLYKLRDNGPNSASRSPNQAEGRNSSDYFWSPACGALATIRQFFLVGDFCPPN